MIFFLLSNTQKWRLLQTTTNCPPPHGFYPWYLEIAVDRYRGGAHIADLSGIPMYPGELMVRTIRVCTDVGWILLIFNTHLSRVFENRIQMTRFWKVNELVWCQFASLNNISHYQFAWLLYLPVYPPIVHKGRFLECPTQEPPNTQPLCKGQHVISHLQMGLQERNQIIHNHTRGWLLHVSLRDLDISSFVSCCALLALPTKARIFVFRFIIK
jgi:hypothetical protein